MRLQHIVVGFSQKQYIEGVGSEGDAMLQGELGEPLALVPVLLLHARQQPRGLNMALQVMRDASAARRINTAIRCPISSGLSSILDTFRYRN